MSDEKVGGIHWSFWVIGAVALLWNLMGSINFFMEMNANALASYPESHRAIIESRPLWATGAFAIAVFGGALGCVLLLLRKSYALYVFIASLIGVIVQLTPHLGTGGTAIGFGPVGILLLFSPSLLVAAFLIWYSRRAQGKGWLGPKRLESAP